MAWTKEQEINCFGCEINDFIESVKKSVTYKYDGETMAYQKIAMSLMSDVQQEIILGMHENARKTLNRAKYLLQQVVYGPKTD